MIKIISFDFGGTLAREVREEYEVFHEILNELDCPTEMNKVREALLRAWEWWLREKREKGRIWCEETLRKVVKLFLSYLRLPSKDNLIAKIVQLYPHKLEFEAYPDTEPTLRQLKEMKYKLIVISNASSKRNVEIYLKKLGLRQYFKEVIVSGSIGYEKPNPQIFLKAAEAMKVSPREILHIGNDFEADYLGAKSAGMKSILIDRENKHEDKQCTRIMKLTELIDLLRSQS